MPEVKFLALRAGTQTVLVQDFEGEFGDRRQELVFIGIAVRRTALETALDACLATPEELVRHTLPPSPCIAGCHPILS